MEAARIGKIKNNRKKEKNTSTVTLLCCLKSTFVAVITFQCKVF